jgi:hypothetical protein
VADQLAFAVPFLWCFAGGAVQFFTRVEETFMSFATSSADFPDAIASLICLQETVTCGVLRRQRGRPDERRGRQQGTH